MTGGSSHLTARNLPVTSSNSQSIELFTKKYEPSNQEAEQTRVRLKSAVRTEQKNAFLNRAYGNSSEHSLSIALRVEFMISKESIETKSANGK